MTLSWHLKFTTVENLPTRMVAQILKVFGNVQKTYQKHGFQIVTALMDGKFMPLKMPLLQDNIQLNCTAANEHVPEIERQICVIKERVHVCRHMLPFTYIPKLMMMFMVINVVMWLNSFPPKGGVSTMVSPRMIMTGDKFDYKKHCQLEFGGYAQVHDELAAHKQTGHENIRSNLPWTCWKYPRELLFYESMHRQEADKKRVHTSADAQGSYQSHKCDGTGGRAAKADDIL